MAFSGRKCFVACFAGIDQMMNTIILFIKSSLFSIFIAFRLLFFAEIENKKGMRGKISRVMQ